MKKQLLLTLAVCMGAAATASAYEVGEIVQTHTTACRITGANQLTNGDFSNGLEGWTSLGGTLAATLSDTLKVFNNDAALGEGKYYLQVVNAGAGSTMGTNLINSPNFRRSYQLAPGNYLITYKVKQQNEGVTSNARWGGRNQNYQDVYINADGTCPYPTQTANNEIKGSLAEWLDNPAGEWVTVNYYYHTDTTAYLNFEFFNLSQFDCFTDFGIYSATECADARIIQNSLDVLNAIVADTENFPNAGQVLNGAIQSLQGLVNNPQALGQQTPNTVNSMLAGIMGNNGALGSYLNSVSADVSSYFSQGGYFSFDNADEKGADKGAANEWSITGNRWGVSAAWANMTTRHIFANINGKYGLGAGSEYISAVLPAGKYLYMVQGAGLAYYGNGSGSSSNYTIVDYVNPRTDAGFFINADSIPMEDLPQAYAKTYMNVFDVKEGGEQTVGFYRKGNAAFSGNNMGVTSGGGEVRFDNMCIRILGKTQQDVEEFYLANSLANAQNALKVMIDSAKTVYADDETYIFGKQTLQDSISVSQAVYDQHTSATQADIDILEAQMPYMRNAINAYYTINREYVQLGEDIVLAQSLLEDENRTEGKQPLSEAIEVANDYYSSLNTSSERDSARLVAEDATLMAAVQTFYNANASFNMPSVIQIANDDFADNAENWINDGLSGNAAWKFGTIETGTATGSVRAMYFNRGNVASDIKWLYQDVPVTGIGAYDFWATLAVHNSRWNSLEENTNTYLYLNNDSINVITMGANDSKNQVLGSWDIFHVVSNVTSLDARENGPDAGHVRIGLEKRSDIDGLQLNMIYFAAPKLYYYGDWDKYLQGIYDVETVDTTYDVYSINGMKVRSNASSLDGLPRGIYIVNGKKYVVK